MPTTFGNTNEEETPNQCSANYKLANQFVLTEDGTVTSISVYLANTSSGHAACNVRGFVYSNGAGLPVTLQGVSDSTAVADSKAAGWVVCSCSTPIVLSAGTYWVGYHQDASAAGITNYIQEVSGSENEGTDTYSDGTSSAWGASGPNTATLSIYATYTPAGLPTLAATVAASAITATTATSGGSITSQGTSALTAWGVCWNTTGSPTIADSHTHDEA